MPITRTFIDWKRPLIPAVVDQLFERYAVLGVCDLRQVVVAFPTRHGLKRFDDLWARKTKGAGHPPRRITVGELPELLYKPFRPFASDLVQKLAWGEAVRALPRHRVEHVLGHLPDDADFDAWLSVGEMLWRTHIELAADGLNFADVAERGSSLPTFREVDRWRAMREMQQTYLATLDELGIWDLQTARLVAIERGECGTDRDIILIGAADLNTAVRQMLDQVSDRVTAYIHASAGLAERFDPHGCLLPNEWESVSVELRDDQLAVVDGPGDQAREVVERLRRLEGSRRMDEITIVVPDERLIPVLRRVLGEHEVASYRAIETTLKETSPYRLLVAVAACLEDERPSQFAELTRHPAITQWLADQRVPARWLVELDDFMSQHLQSRLGHWPELAADKYAALQRAYELVSAFLSQLSGEARLLGEWTATVREFLLSVYGAREFNMNDDADHLAVESCRRLSKAFEENQEVPEALMPALMGYQAIKLTLASIAGESIPTELQLDGVELLGWLDLAQDDNPVVVLTSFNEGYVPSSANSDLFLPNSLRQHLGLTDNSRRYARDLHALQALLASRDGVSLIVGRRDVRNDPLVPSRLLFATDGETIAARIRRFYDRASEPDDVTNDASATTGTRPLELLTERTRTVQQPVNRLAIPKPVAGVELPQRLSVSAFKSYLACPYRFYLKHVLKLKEVEEGNLEMTARGFGSFLHEIMREFGLHPAARSVDAKEVQQTILDSLLSTAARWFGNDPLPVVKIQLEQVRRRLLAFAVWQTRQNQEGWRIQRVEHDLEMPLGRTKTLIVTGRIDRIDWNERSGVFRVLDYKTSDKAKTPDKAHRSNKKWIDLQLPLYRQLAMHNSFRGELELGYVNLSGQDECLLSVADWKGAEFEEADRLSLDVVDAILGGKFLPMSTKESDARDFARICQEGVIGREVPQ